MHKIFCLVVCQERRKLLKLYAKLDFDIWLSLLLSTFHYAYEHTICGRFINDDL